MEYDKTDEKILNELGTDSKIPLRELAVRAETSYVTVMNRIKKLESKGIITGYSASLDLAKLGYDVHVMIQVRISKGKTMDIQKSIAKHPNVVAVYDTTGSFDSIVFARFKTTKAMDNFLKKLQTFEYIERTNTQLVLNTVKAGQIML